MSLISPPLSAATAIARLDGWDLVMQCPKCGPRVKPVHELYAAVGRATPIGKVFPRLSCPTCRTKPATLTGVCSWVAHFSREAKKEDLSCLLPKPEAMAA